MVAYTCWCAGRRGGCGDAPGRLGALVAFGLFFCSRCRHGRLLHPQPHRGRTHAGGLDQPRHDEALTRRSHLAAAPVITVVAMLMLLVPTMIWVRLRAPWAKGLIEFLCLLPLTIPALVIVVGLRNVYLWVNYLLGESALADVRLRPAGAAVRLSRDRRRAVLDRRADPRRSGPLAGRGVVDHHRAGARAEHLVGHPVRRVHLDRGGPGRVHDRFAARLRTCRC